MINEFQLDYYTRLRSWSTLREKLNNVRGLERYIAVDNFWQQTPITTHYLHPRDMENWPDPWQLLDDNLYCPYARAYGMVATLYLLGEENIDIVDATDHTSTDVALVLVGTAKYILNYWPGTVVNNKLQDFTIVRYHDTTPLIRKIGRL
jgi:hypothetical protein